MDSSSYPGLATTLNNTSGELIACGDYDGAISRLSNALVLSRQVLEDACEPSNASLDVTLDKCMSLSQLTCMAQSPLTCGDDESDGSLFLYRRAIVLPEGARCCYETSVISSVVIIFNLALCHQLAAERDATRRMKYLKKAAKLYDLAHSLYHEKNSFDESAFFLVASVNNLGLVYQELHETRTAEKCFQHLLSTLMFLVDCGAGNISEFDSFFRNATHLTAQNNTAAAA